MVKNFEFYRNYNDDIYKLLKSLNGIDFGTVNLTLIYFMLKLFFSLIF